MRANENERRKSLRVVWVLLPETAFAIALMVGVSGCASHRETFDCAPGAGVGCKSISQVNEMVDQTSAQSDLSQTAENQAPLSTFTNTHISTNPAPLDLGSETLVPAARVPPSGVTHVGVLKVWVAPFTDEEGNFHEAALIHIPQGDKSQDGDAR